jgi:catabolite regulation protein CreA
LTERLSKDFFSDPSDASVTCVKTGTIQIADNIATGKNGEVRLDRVAMEYF